MCSGHTTSNMKILHCKIIVDDVVSEEYISIEDVEQVGYSTPVPLGKISLKTANLLVKELNDKIASIPF
jgi:hypothetical protein